MPLRILLTGQWLDGDVLMRGVKSTCRATPQYDQMIESAWREAKAALGESLFDGPMCRFEGYEVLGRRLVIRWSQTGYREFLGTNMTRPELPGDERANPVGVSTGLVSVDGWFMLGRRSGNVAYYPHRLHPFSGSLEPSADVNLFAEARRELHEELSLSDADVAEIALLGIVEDTKLNHPETILSARSTLSRAEVEARMDRHEHTACWACRDDPDALAAAAAEMREQLTPVALGAILLHGRQQFGDSWLQHAVVDLA